MLRPSRKRKLFNLQHAVLGAVLMGLAVVVGNLKVGIIPALKAGCVQASLSFLIIGVNMALHEALLKRYGRLTSILIPSLFTTTIAGLLHQLTGTPQFFTTLAIVFFSAVLGFVFWVEISRRFRTIQPLQIIKDIASKISNYLQQSSV